MRSAGHRRAEEHAPQKLEPLPGSIALHDDLPLQPPRQSEVMTATASPLFVRGGRNRSAGDTTATELVTAAASIESPALSP